MKVVVNETKEVEATERMTIGQWSAPWLGGLVLIVIGSAFLIQNITGYRFDNWWALFIAIPGVFALIAAWRLYEQNGRRFTGSVAAVAIGAVFPLLVAAIFLLRLDWGEVWPLFLIAAGLVAIVPRASGRTAVDRETRNDQ